MRILHLLDHSIPLHSAYSHRAQSLLRHQRALGWHTIHLTGPAQGPMETVDRNEGALRFFRTAPLRGPAARLPLLDRLAAVHAMARRLRQVARLTRPDLLHAHPPLVNAYAALRAGRQLGLPVLLELAPDHASPLAGVLARHAARRADAVAVAARAQLQALQAQGIAPARLLLVPAALSLRQHPPRQLPHAGLAAALGLGRGPVLACCEALDEDQGAALLLRALPALLQRHPDLTLLLAGDGPQRAALAVQAAPLGERVVFAGAVRAEHMARYQDLADILVWPRTAAPRQQGALLAALARGAVVLASDIASHRDLVEHGTNGLLHEAGNVGSLQDALMLLLDEPGCWPRLRAAARERVEREHSVAACAAAYGPLYRRLLELRPRR